MIRYSLKCPDDHVFDSWFRNSEAFDALTKAGQINCTICGSSKVEKAIMAPAVNGAKKKGDVPPAEVEAAPLSTPANPAEMALRKMREHIEST